MMRTLRIALPVARTNEKEEMTPEALKLLAVVLARDGGFFDIKANVAARTELGASGYLRIEPHGKQCRLTITPMGRTALALGSKEQSVE
jgi:hypothetical protein